MEWIAAYEMESAFDLNRNVRIDFADIVKLFGKIKIPSFLNVHCTCLMQHYILI
jgi:hypothetical protein